MIAAASPGEGQISTSVGATSGNLFEHPVKLAIINVIESVLKASAKPLHLALPRRDLLVCLRDVPGIPHPLPVPPQPEARAEGDDGREQGDPSECAHPSDRIPTA